MQRSSTTCPDSRTITEKPIDKVRAQNLDGQTYHHTERPENTGRTENRKSTDSTDMLSSHESSSKSAQRRTLANIYRAKVIEAYRNRQIFTVFGNYNTVRRALLQRGWLEKLPPGRFPKLRGLPEEVLLSNARQGNQYEAAAISRIINQFPAFFIWQPKGLRDLYRDVLPHRNRVRRSRCMDFATKVGLIGCAEQESWHREDGVSGMSYPRFHRLGGTIEDKQCFIEDFRQTQCRSLLKYMLEHIDRPEVLRSENADIPATVLYFAVNQVENQLAEWDHSSIDDEDGPTSKVEPFEWSHFLEKSKDIVLRKARLRINLTELIDLSHKCRSLLERLEERRPDYKWDGCRNLWILKPGYQCRGIGITIRGSLDSILSWANTNTNRRYIAQKYVERPLLVYSTKFDIRQYMLLVIEASTVSIWLYKNCYLRFSSQEFSMDDLKESIHLTNNSVQKKYKNKLNRDPRLPKCNMWSLEQFKVFLKQRKALPNTWSQKIYAGFRENLIAVVRASLEETTLAVNSFELYGCDFMLDEHYNPILIEINSTPDMTPSTPVTARICPQALRDVIKVIIDLPKNSRTPTGDFEKVYQVAYTNDSASASSMANVVVSGKPMTIHKMMPKVENKFFRKPINFIKKAENSIRKKLQHAKVQTPPPPPPPERPHTPPRKHVILNNGPLDCFTKEALALHYTFPK